MAKNKTIYFASSNKNKLKEVKSILKAQSSRPLCGRGSLASRAAKLKAQIKSAPKGFKVIENGKTFTENAYKKASTLSKEMKSIAFADDSGIEVFALNRKPGIKSSRFFRNGKGMIDIINKVNKKKNKKCCFTCALVVTNKKGKVIFKTKKSWYGRIANKPRGKNGFGYDPIFIIPKLGKTSAEISSRLKNKLSHRAMAISEFAKWLIKSYKL